MTDSPTVPRPPHPTSKALVLYMQLVNADGDYQFTIDVRERKHDNTVKGLVTPVMALHDRLRIHHLSLPFPRLEVPHSTTLDIVILTGGQEIDRQELTVFSRMPSTEDGSQAEAT